MLPEIATGLGKVIREIRKATADIRQDIELDDMIRKPLQELRDAATLPPEELKRRDEAKAAQRKAQRKKLVASARLHKLKKFSASSRRPRPKPSASSTRLRSKPRPPQRFSPNPQVQSDVVSAGGTMILNPLPPQTFRP